MRKANFLYVFGWLKGISENKKIRNICVVDFWGLSSSGGWLFRIFLVYL